MPKITDLSKFIEEVHNNAVDHGWHDEYRSFGDLLSLMHSELSEALQEYRNSKCYHYYVNDKNNQLAPHGIAVELADCVLRIFDWAGMMGVDLESILVEKHQYNISREFKHGGKLL